MHEMLQPSHPHPSAQWGGAAGRTEWKGGLLPPPGAPPGAPSRPKLLGPGVVVNRANTLGMHIKIDVDVEKRRTVYPNVVYNFPQK